MKRPVLASLMFLAAGASCSTQVVPVGGLMVVMRTDGSLQPDQLRVEVTSSDGTKTFRSATYGIPTEVTLPTTLAIASDGDPGDSVVISVSVWAGSQPVDLRQNEVFQIPTERVAELDVVFSATCTSEVSLVGEMAVSNCKMPDTTCSPASREDGGEGQCVSSIVNATGLAAFTGSGAPPNAVVNMEAGTADATATATGEGGTSDAPSTPAEAATVASDATIAPDVTGASDASDATGETIQAGSSGDGEAGSAEGSSECNGATCDPQHAASWGCTGTACTYTCSPGWSNCNTTAPNSAGCECDTPGCCSGACQTIHNTGVAAGSLYYDCNPPATAGQAEASLLTQATAACAAYSGGASHCSSALSCSGYPNMGPYVCNGIGGTGQCTTCWSYGGTDVLNTENCDCPGTATGTWN